MRLTRVTAPVGEPVTLPEAKAHLRLEGASDDAYVTALIVAARMYAEEYAWRGFVTQTWERTMRGFPGEWAENDAEIGWRGGSLFPLPSRSTLLSPDYDAIELPWGNLVSIESIKYYDTDGVQQTLATSVYEADSASAPGPGFARLKYGQAWPGTRDQWNAVVVRYVVGWAVDAVPMPIKQAIFLLVSQMYEQRTPEVTGGVVSKVQFAFEALLHPYRLARLNR